MAKRNPSPQKPSQDPASKDRAKDRKEPAKQSLASGVRETIESVVIAFALAFLFRTFVAEAFVIPTGSMATTLMGRHKDVTCVECGYPFQVNASDEVNAEGVPLNVEITGCICPMCRYRMNIGPENPQHESYPSYTGDRILVGKFMYEVSDPQRWDVAVFKYPGDAQTNYIKRLVGLPNEAIRIDRGDIFVKGLASEEFHIARKPPEKMRAVLRPVFDNDYGPKITRLGFPPRWQSRDAGFKAEDDGASFVSDPAAGLSSLYYANRVPTQHDWLRIPQRFDPARDKPVSVAPQLVSDFLGYNTELGGRNMNPEQTLGTHWVGDLALECTVDIQSAKGSLIFELVKGGRQFQCYVNLADGAAQMAIQGDDTRDFRPTAKTPLAGPGKHTILFSNIDRQLRLFVDGKVVAFDGRDEATCYGDLGNVIPTEADLKPAAIAADGAAVRVSHLKVLRDLFYISTVRALDTYGRARSVPLDDFAGGNIEEFFASPKLWPAAYGRSEPTDFRLAANQFLALGDNSAKSKDSRYWADDGVEFYVSRDLLSGKAFFIYWPHSWNRPVPFFPNFSRMGFVR